MKQNIRVKRSYNYNGKCMITQDLCWKGGNFCEQCETVLNYKPISQKQNEQKRFVKNCDPCFMMNELGFKSCEMCKGSKEETLKAIDEAQKREEGLLFGNKPISKKENINQKPKNTIKLKTAEEYEKEALELIEKENQKSITEVPKKKNRKEKVKEIQNNDLNKKENDLKIIEKPKKEEIIVVKKENFIIKLLKKFFGD